LQFRQLGTLGGSGSIIGVKAKVTVLNAVVQDCPANPLTGSNIRARASFLGWFFNHGTSTGPTDDTGNIIVGLHLAKEANGSNQIQPVFVNCTNASCSTTVTPPGVTVPPLTIVNTWSPNTTVVVKIVWGRVNGKFKVGVKDTGTLAVESIDIVYQGIVPDAGSPVNGDFKHIRVQNHVKNCSTGRKQVVMDALFDAIKVKRVP